MLRSSLLFFVFSAFAPLAFAQNVGGVFGPVVNENDRSIQYRAGFSPGQDGGPDRFVHRIHYQHAFSDRLRWRLVAQGSDVETGDLESNLLGAELLWQFKDQKSDGWNSALRFDGRLSEGDDGAHSLGVNWTSQFALEDDWSLIGIIMLSDQVGDRTVDGTFVQTRASLTRRLENGNRLALEMFNAHGDIGDLPDLDQQRISIGPGYSVKVTEDWSVYTGLQLGVTDPARDVDFRLWFGKSF